MIQHSVETADCVEKQLGMIAEEYFDAVARGETPDVAACAAQYPELAQEIRDLFPALELVKDLPSKPASTDPLAAEIASQELNRLGDYEILREIGRGGMGVVYEANQISLNRRVALKVLPFTAMADPKQLARFKNEAHAAANLDHPNIVDVYAVGCEQSVHFFAMRYIKGLSAAELIAELRLLAQAEDGRTTSHEVDVSEIAREITACRDARRALSGSDPTIAFKQQAEKVASSNTQTQRDVPAAISTQHSGGDRQAFFRNIAELGIQAASALDHAHEHGILHRDIKPGNLMLDSHGKLWVTDFGLARIEAEAGMTMTGDILGTLRYMSPEQALAKRVVVDQRSDIYSLGVTLFEMLSLEPAYAAADRQALFKQIAFEEPRRLRQVDPRIPPELETIVGKAIEKSPDSRYQTAQELADDLQRFLDHEPIRAQPPTLVNRATKWSRRHVGVVWTAIGALVLLSIVLICATALIAQSQQEAVADRKRAVEERQVAIDQRNAAIRERSIARRNLYRAEIVAGQIEASRKNFGGLYNHLLDYLPLKGDLDYREWEWYHLMSQCQQQYMTLLSPSDSTCAAWSPDGECLAAPAAIWDAESKRWIQLFSTSKMGLGPVAWSPDASCLAWGVKEDENAIYVYNRATDEIDRYGGYPSSVRSLAWSPDGKRLVGASVDGALKVWDVLLDSVVWDTTTKTQALNLSWSPDGKLLAGGLMYVGVAVWDLGSRELVYELPSETKYCAACWNPDGSRLAVCTEERWFWLDRDSWHESESRSIANGSGVQYSPDGSHIAILEGRSLRVCDSSDGETIDVLNGHRSRVTSVSWHPDSTRLATADDNRNILLWDIGSRREQTQFATESTVSYLAWGDNNKTIRTFSDNHRNMTIWDLNSAKPVRREEFVLGKAAQINPICQISTRKVGTHSVEITDALDDNVLNRIELDSERELRSWKVSDDGMYLMTQSHLDNTLSIDIWDINRGDLVTSIQREGVSVQPGKYYVPIYEIHCWPKGTTHFVATGMGDRHDRGSTVWREHLYVYDVISGAQVFRHISDNRDSIKSVAWSDAHQLLACGTELGSLKIFNLKSQGGSASSDIDRTQISAIALHPSGQRLAASSDAGVIFILNSSGKVLLTFETGQNPIKHLAWSSDGQQLASASVDGVITIWDATSAYRSTSSIAHQSELAMHYMALAQRSYHGVNTKVRDRVMELAGDDLGFWRDRGMMQAASSNFQEAADEFGKITLVQPNLQYSFEPACQQAMALLAAKRVDRYRQVCRDLIAANMESPVPSNSGYAAWLCSLTPNSLIDSSSVVDAAKTFLTNEQRHPHKDSRARIILGAALYRDGQYQQAKKELANAAEKCKSTSNTHVVWMSALTEILSSMVLQELGEEFQARRRLESALRKSELFLSRTPATDWERIVPLETLKQEASLSIVGGMDR